VKGRVACVQRRAMVDRVIINFIKKKIAVGPKLDLTSLHF
jgi:hypothetical protein